MALWRDPLDELIGDLERAIPAVPRAEADGEMRVEELQFCVGIILWGSEEAKASLHADPRYNACMRT